MPKLKYQARISAIAVVLGALGACAGTPHEEVSPQAGARVEAEAAPVSEAVTEAANQSAAETQPASKLADTAQLQDGAQSVVSLPSFASSGHARMDAWRDEFAARAMREGHAPEIVYDVLRDIGPLETYLPKDPRPTGNQSAVSEQAEFAKPVWEYLRTAVSDTRKVRGASEIGEDRATFEAIEAAYGVDKHVVAAIWGMETNFGGFIGNFDGPETLANMAVEGRRIGLAEKELLATMTLIGQGLTTRAQLISGWAGAMGQTQFMPSTLLAYGVDFSGDGHRDVWATRADALASAANYLKASGYVRDEPWGLEVTVPDSFDYGLSDGGKLSAQAWSELGVAPIRGGAISELAGGPERRARLWLPAGASGPKYLLFKNFDVFLTYNRSNSYAFSVGLLADAIGGQDGPVATWPIGLAVLSKAEVKEMQTGLNALGFDAGIVDGVVGNGTRRALRSFQKANGLIADGYPTVQALGDVRARQ